MKNSKWESVWTQRTKRSEQLNLIRKRTKKSLGMYVPWPDRYAAFVDEWILHSFVLYLTMTRYQKKENSIVTNRETFIWIMAFDSSIGLLVLCWIYLILGCRVVDIITDDCARHIPSEPKEREGGGRRRSIQNISQPPHLDLHKIVSYNTKWIDRIWIDTQSKEFNQKKP